MALERGPSAAYAQVGKVVLISSPSDTHMGTADYGTKEDSRDDPSIRPDKRGILKISR